MPAPAPITFACRTETSVPLADAADRILIPDNWASFTGWGSLPGIRSATFEAQPPCVVGTVVRVVSTNGDTYRETITVWEPDRLIEIRMSDFTRPLSWFATEFIERWTAEDQAETENQHTVVRAFEMHPTCGAARPVLRVIGAMLRRAVRRHCDAVLSPASVTSQPG